MRHIIFSLLLALAIPVAAETYTYEQLAKSLQDYDLSARTAELQALSPEALVSEGHRLLAAETMPILVKEHLLYQVSLELGQLPRTAATESLAKKMLSYESAINIHQLDGGHHQHWQAYLVAANIRAIRHYWQLQDSWSQFSATGTFNPGEFIQYLQVNNDRPTRQMLNLALSQMNAGELSNLITELKANQTDLSAQYLLTIGRAAADSGLYLRGLRTAVKQGEHNLQVGSVINLNQVWSGEELSEVLTEMLAKGIYPGVALQQIAALPYLSETMQTTLLALLADRNLGGDAAAALAKHMDTNLMTVLTEQLENEDQVVKRRAMLALKMSQDEDAVAVLRQHLQREPNQQLARELLP